MSIPRQLRPGDAFRAARPGTEGRTPYVVVEVLGDEITYREIWQLPKGSGQWEAGRLRIDRIADLDGFEEITAPPSYRLAKTVRPPRRDLRPPAAVPA